MELLRDELTKRGVEWEAFDDFEQTTQWSTHNGAFVYWARERDGKLLVETTAPTKCSASCSPEQAIDATLGPDTDGRMSGFQWHLMVDEAPEYGTNDYVVMGTRGALYVASEYSKYSQEGKGAYFYIPNRRDNFVDSKSVLAWAVIPPLEVDE